MSFEGVWEPTTNTYLTGTRQVLHNIHPRSACEGRHCVIHDPSSHDMRGFPTNWRYDKLQMERICPHGVGHPDPNDLEFHMSHGRDWMGVHGCDGCCAPDIWAAFMEQTEVERKAEERALEMVDVVEDVHVDA